MKHKIPAPTLLGALLVAGFLLADPGLGDSTASGGRPTRDFYFGIELDRNAPDATKQLFYETGMNCVRLTGGGYEWSVESHKKIADEFATRGLKVYMQLGSHYPDGSYFSLTDAIMVDQDGKPGVPDKSAWAITYGDDHWPQYAYTSAPFREKLAKDFTSYVGKFADNHNVAGVILHNEPGYFWQSKRIFDYNPTTIAAFRKWLEKEDGSIATLNARWGSTYKTFEEVIPPGLPPETNLAAWMDWRRFSVAAVEDFMTWEAGFFQGLRKDIPRTTNLDGPLNNWYGYRCANMLQYSSPMDRVGIDIYPAAWSSRDLVPYATDMVQGVAQGREGHVLECEAFSKDAKDWKQYDEKQRAGLLRSEVWTMIGHGMSGVLIWGFDTFHGPDAKFNERIMACRDIAHQTAMIGMRDFRRTKSRVALCVDPDSYLYENGVEKKPLELTSLLDHELGGYHAALEEAGIQSDVIFADQLRAQVWKNYDAIVMPSAMMMDEVTAGELKNFVSGGGTLIAGAPLAGMDRWGKAQGTVPGFGLDQLFGCRLMNGVSPGAMVTPQGDLADTDALAGELRGASALYFYADKTPAITSNLVGKGHAVLIAGKVGAAFLDWAHSDVLPGILAGVLKEGGVLPGLKGQKGGAIDLTALEDGRGNVLVAAVLPVANGKIPEPVRDAKIVYHCADPGRFRSAFAFPPTAAEKDIVRSGPVSVVLQADVETQSVSFQPGEITAAMPVLLAKEAGPLLAVEAPQKMVKGQEAELAVTCFNPSAQAVQGQFKVVAGGGVTLGGAGVVSISVPSYDQRKAVMKVKVQADGAVPRVPLTVVLTLADGSEIKSVPVDIAVQ